MLFMKNLDLHFCHLENLNVGIMVMMIISMTVMCDHGDALVGNNIDNQIV